MKEWLKAAGLKIRTLLDPGVLLDKCREALDVRPRDPGDYYTLLFWMVSKKLAVALAALAGAAGLLALTVFMPRVSREPGGAGAVRSYSYRDVPLRFYKGEVRILGNGGYKAYEGAVEKGEVKGTGRLYDRAGALIYEGEFAGSRYNGAGRLYYKNGKLSFEGAFRDNVPQGEGTAYREDGSREYEGSFDKGERSGTGILYDTAAKPVYKGEFSSGLPRLEEFLGKTTAEAGGKYTGRAYTYLSEQEMCVWMKDIQGLYRAVSGDDSLEGEWIIDQVFVLKNEFPVDQAGLKTKKELLSCFGEPSYEGKAYFKLPELAAGDSCQKAAGAFAGSGGIKGTESFRDVFQVRGIQRIEGNILVFTKDSLVYTFYMDESGEAFSYYAVEPAG